jgi:hypothetical protein
VAAVAVASVLALLALVPLTNAYRGGGIVAAAPGSVIVRASKAGQLARIAVAGDAVERTSVLAVVEKPAQTESGSSAAKESEERLASLNAKREGVLRLIAEKYEISLLGARQSEALLKERLAMLKTQFRGQQDLAAEAEALRERLAALHGQVTRLDTLSLAERSVAARGRLLELEADMRRTEVELQAKAREMRVLEIDRARESESAARLYSQEQGELLQRATSESSAVLAGAPGVVRVLYKQKGDWVAPGDELAMVSAGGGDAAASRTVTVHVPAAQANLLARGQAARVWPAGSRKADAPLTGKVAAVSQRTAEGSRVRAEAGSAPGSFVADVALDAGGANAENGLAMLRAGSEVDVEIVFGSTPLYEALLPKRFTRSRETRPST